jgi:flagellar hook-associated protein 2
MATSIGSATSSTAAASSTTTAAKATTSAPSAAANIVSSLGAGSGIDTKALAASLVAAEKAPRAEAINKNIAKNESLVSGFAAVKYLLGNLQTAFDDLKDKSDYSSITATNSNASALGVVVSANAVAGNHAVNITSLARAQRSTGRAAFWPWSWLWPS